MGQSDLILCCYDNNIHVEGLLPLCVLLLYNLNDSPYNMFKW